MGAGMIATAYGRSGRHLRFVTLIAALAVIDIWLWTRLFDGGSLVASETALAATSVTAGAIAACALWRRPLGRNIRMMTTPALTQSLATHQAGHIVAAHVQDPNWTAKVSLSDPCSRRPDATPVVGQTELHSELVVAFAGMTAEEIFLGETGSHSADDLARATSIGADMVGRLGMSGSLVSLATTRPRRKKFVASVLDDARARKELESKLRDAKRETTRLMLENRHLIITLRDALLRHSQLSARAVAELIDNAEKLRHSEDAVLVDLRSASTTHPLIKNAHEL